MAATSDTRVAVGFYLRHGVARMAQGSNVAKVRHSYGYPESEHTLPLCPHLTNIMSGMLHTVCSWSWVGVCARSVCGSASRPWVVGLMGP